MKANWVRLCLLLGCLISTGRITAQEVTPTGTAVANFYIGSHLFGIFPVLTNGTSPVEQWQFRYEPLLLPEMDAQGRLAVVVGQDGDEWTATLVLHLGSPEANRLAYQNLMKAYPNSAGKITESNVSQLRLEEIAFHFDPQIPQGLGRLVTGPIHPGASPTVELVFTASSQEAANKLEALLRSPSATLKCDYKYSTRATKQGTVGIIMQDLRGTKLEVALDGVPNKDEGKYVYVRRHELRKLTENVHREMHITEISEDPNLVDHDVIKTLLDRWHQQITLDLQHLDKQKLKASYNAQDLAPDKIEHQVNDWFRKVQGRDEYQANKHILSEAGFDIVKLFGASGKNQISFNEKQVKEFLEENGYHVDFTGERIVPKRIDLQRVNMADFKEDFQVTQTKVYVGENIIRSNPVDVQIQQRVAGKAAISDLAGHLAELERRTSSALNELRSDFDHEVKLMGVLQEEKLSIKDLQVKTVDVSYYIGPHVSGKDQANFPTSSLEDSLNPNLSRREQKTEVSKNITFPDLNGRKIIAVVWQPTSNLGAVHDVMTLRYDIVGKTTIRVTTSTYNVYLLGSRLLIFHVPDR